MTKIDPTPFSEQDRDHLDFDEGGGHRCEPVQISFEQSIEAYRLAIETSVLRSPEDLVLSGTWQIYEQRTASIAMKHASRDPFVSYLAMDAQGSWTTSNSRQSYRSALVRMAARDVTELTPIYWRQIFIDVGDAHAVRGLVRRIRLSEYSDAQNRIRDAVNPLRYDQMKTLSSAIDFLLHVPPDPHHTALRERPDKGDKLNEPQRSRYSESKKIALYALNQHQRRKAKILPNYDWRSHFWTLAVIPDDHLDDDRRACIAALMLTGCRPSEFSNDLGVTVQSMTKSNHPALRFEIFGAKVFGEIGDHSGKGQDRREIELICQTPEAVWLFDQVLKLDEGAAVLQLSTATHKQTGELLMPSERGRRVSACLGKLTTRLGKIAFPKQQHNLTPYVFRHALASDFKTEEDALDGLDLATVLGHQSVRTQEHYGNANSARGLSGSRALQITHMTPSTPVRQPVRPGYASTQSMEDRPENHPRPPKPD